MTSRRESDIEENLADSITSSPLSIHGEDADIDIGTYVKAQLAIDSTLSKWPGPELIKLEVEEVLTTKAKGM